MPGPVSATTSRTRSSSAEAPTRMRDPDGQYLTALSTRFDRTCSSARGSPSTAGRLPAASLGSEAHALLLGALPERARASGHDPLQLDPLALGSLNSFDSSFESSSMSSTRLWSCCRVCAPDDVQEDGSPRPDPPGSRRSARSPGRRTNRRDLECEALVRGVGHEVAAERLEAARSSVTSTKTSKQAPGRRPESGRAACTRRRRGFRPGSSISTGRTVVWPRALLDHRVELGVPHRLR